MWVPYSMGRPPKKDMSKDFLRLLETVAQNIAILREDLGISQAQLARDANISTTTMNAIESLGKRDIRLSTLFALANVLDVNVVRLFLASDVGMKSEDAKKLMRASEDIRRIVSRYKKKPRGGS